MEESLNYAERTVTKKAEGKNLTKRLLMIGLYILVFAGIVVLIALTKGAMAVLGGVLFVLLVALVFFTWRLVKEDYKYEVANAKLKVSHLSGNGKEKLIFEEFVSKFSLIAPMNDEYKAQIEAVDETIDYRGDSKSPDSYAALLEKDGKKVAVCFEATNKMLKVMKFYNKNATVVTEVRY